MEMAVYLQDSEALDFTCDLSLPGRVKNELILP
jgi:hypothetical protein